MCQFCTEHGEGKKWYLQMKNYSDVLLHEELSSSQKDIVEATTRLEALVRGFENSVIPAISGVSKTQTESPDAPPPTEESSKVQPSEDEIVARRKIGYFGQVLPIEDVEKVIDMVDSITRYPCGCRFTTTGKTDKRYCFGFGTDRMGILGRFPDAASSLEVLDREEAKRIFHAYDEEGLVHSVWSCAPPYVYAMCNCDRDCVPPTRGTLSREAPLLSSGRNTSAAQTGTSARDANLV